jgi:toxin YoeB
VKVLLTEEAWEDHRSWTDSDPHTLERLNALIEDVRRNKCAGLGNPERLKGDLAGWWSRRITGEHRLVHRIAGKPGADQCIEIVACGYHYGS